MGKRVWNIVVGIGVIIAIVAGLMTIIGHFQNSIDSFVGNIDEQAMGDSLVTFAQSHDSKVVWLNVVCHEDKPGHPCETGDYGSALQQQSSFENKVVIAVHATSGDYWLHVEVGSTNAEADNGPFGAGSIVIKGYFTISNRGKTGITPDNVNNIDLDGVDSSTIKNS